MGARPGARSLNVEESLMRAVLRQAAQQGMITAIVKDRYYRNDRIVEFAQLIRELDLAAWFNLRGGFPRYA